MKRNLNLLFAIINAYKGKEDLAHFSTCELNKKFGISKNNIPKMLKELVDLNYVENHTINGFYNRYKILKDYPCPNFILNEKLTNAQKGFLLRCIEQNITEDLSRKEIARRVNGNENCGNLKRTIDGILRVYNNESSIFGILNNYSYISLIPENAVYIENKGYRSITSQEKAHKKSETQSEKIAKHLRYKSENRAKKSSRYIEYSITEDYIESLLLKQEYKDYYTGLIPENYEDYSIDRIDSNLGYVEGNIVITTTRVNVAKNDMTTEEFKKLISDLYNNISNF